MGVLGTTMMWGVDAIDMRFDRKTGTWIPTRPIVPTKSIKSIKLVTMKMKRS